MAVKYPQIALTALKALSSNKLRTLLTILGILIGITAVSILVSLGASLQSTVTSQILKLGVNLVVVLPGPPGRTFNESASTLTVNDAKRIAKVPGVVAVAPYAPLTVKLSANGKSLIKVVNVTTQAFGKVMPANMDYGHFDISNNGIVLSHATAVELFGSEKAAVGKSVFVNGYRLTVRGVAAEANGITGGPSTYVPANLMSRISHTDIVNAIYFIIKNANLLKSVENKIQKILLKEENGVQNFHFLTNKQILNSVSRIINILTGVLGGIAAISLLVGGIGVMNIMWVTVAERTREIGLRKAVGATEFDILLQFLLESIVMVLIGGIIGLLLGFLGAKLIGQIVDLSVSLTVEAIALALGTAVFTGLVFGVAPAIKAAKLEPMVALRYE
jgi:putative ABC transport system permease protein